MTQLTDLYCPHSTVADPSLEFLLMRRLLLLAALPLAVAAPAFAQDAHAGHAAQAGTATPAFASNRITVEVVGSGPDVVLIPGLSSSPAVWRSTIAAMPGYRYHLIHVRGFAGLAPDANANGPVVSPVADEIARYVRDGGLNRPALVGHSLGGTLAMMVATRHPDSVGRLMVVDMFPFIGAMFGGPTATPDSVRPMAEQIRTGISSAAGDGRRAQIEQTIAGMVRTENMRSGAVEDSMNSDPATSGQAMYDIITTDLTADLVRFTGPFRVLYATPPSMPVSHRGSAFFIAAPIQVRRRPKSSRFPAPITSSCGMSRPGFSASCGAF
jgi:pimeloyl-ACP methyl ester carboxylesterase